jgi:hypothetical protein
MLLLFVLGLCSASVCAATSKSPVLGPLSSKQSWQQSSAALCSEAVGAGAQAGMCALLGEGYPLTSAPDFLAAGRFKGFALGATALSTDPNTMGIVADYTLETEELTSRLDATKRITGKAQVGHTGSICDTQFARMMIQLTPSHFFCTYMCAAAG